MPTDSLSRPQRTTRLELGIQAPNSSHYSTPGHRRTRTDDFAVARYWRILWRRKWTIILFAAAVFTMAGIASFLKTPLYEARGRISVGREQSDVLGLNQGLEFSGDSSEYNMYLDAQLHILRSATVIEQAAKDLEVLGFPIESGSVRQAENISKDQAENRRARAIQNRLDIVRIPRTPIIELRYSHHDPRVASAYVNQLMHAYVEQNFQTKYDSTMQVSGWLTERLRELKENVEVAQQKLVDYEQQRGILGVDDSDNVVTAKLNELNRQLTAAETDRLDKQAIYDHGYLDGGLLPAASADPVIQNLKQQQSAIENQYAQATAGMGSAHPMVLELKNQLDYMKAALARETARVAAKAKADYQIALKRERMLRVVFEAQKQEANEFNKGAIQYNMLNHDLQSSQQLYDGLLQKLKEASVSAGLKSNNVRVVDTAHVPDEPSEPNIPLNLAVGLMLGCLGGGLLALVLDRFDDSLQTLDDVEIVTALQPMAVIPMAPSVYRHRLKSRYIQLLAESENKAELVVHLLPRSEVAESYRALKTALLLTPSAIPPKVIVITSALPGEGKTTTAINCAMVLAQNGVRVLLIDGDLRAPRIHQALGIIPRTGLATLLESSPTVSSAEVIVPSVQSPTLFVLPAGPLSEQPSELLASATMKRLLAQWREEFDHIVIDTPPVLAATDSVILSTQADAVLLTVRPGKTTKDAVARATELLSQVGVRVTGVVVNGVDLGEPGANYYRYPYWTGSSYKPGQWSS